MVQMRIRWLPLLLLLITLVPLVGCASSQAIRELEAIAERAKARDEAEIYYVNLLGLTGPLDPAQEYLLKEFAPIYATFQAYKALSPKGNELWDDYLKNTSI